MNAFIQFCQTIINPLIVIFTISNLASMGLQINIPQVIKTMRNPKFLGLVLGWGWVVGPALGYLITVVIPLAEPYAAVVLITSLAPCAPSMPREFWCRTASRPGTSLAGCCAVRCAASPS